MRPRPRKRPIGYWRAIKQPQRFMIRAALKAAGFESPEADPFITGIMKSIGTEREPLFVRQYRAMAEAADRFVLRHPDRLDRRRRR